MLRELKLETRLEENKSAFPAEVELWGFALGICIVSYCLNIGSCWFKGQMTTSAGEVVR